MRSPNLMVPLVGPRLRTQVRTAGLGVLTIGVMLALLMIAIGNIVRERRR